MFFYSYVSYHVLPGSILQHYRPHCTLLLQNRSAILVEPFVPSFHVSAVSLMVVILYFSSPLETINPARPRLATLSRDSPSMLRRHPVVWMQFTHHQILVRVNMPSINQDVLLEATISMNCRPFSFFSLVGAELFNYQSLMSILTPWPCTFICCS